MQCFQHSKTSHVLTADAFGILKITFQTSGHGQLYYQVSTNTIITLNWLYQPTDAKTVEFSSMQKEFSEAPQGS